MLMTGFYAAIVWSWVCPSPVFNFIFSSVSFVNSHAVTNQPSQVLNRKNIWVYLDQRVFSDFTCKTDLGRTKVICIR